MKTILVLSILFSVIALPGLGELTTQDLEKIREIVKASETELKSEIEKTNTKLDAIDTRLRTVETGVAELRGRNIGFSQILLNIFSADRLQRDWIGIDISGKAADLVVERIRDDQGLFQEIVARTDIPKRTDLGHIPRYNAPENKTQLYGEQAGNCNGCGEHFQKQHLEVDHIIARSVGGTDHIEISNCSAVIAIGSKAIEDRSI